MRKVCLTLVPGDGRFRNSRGLARQFNSLPKLGGAVCQYFDKVRRTLRKTVKIIIGDIFLKILLFIGFPALFETLFSRILEVIKKIPTLGFG